MGLSVDALVSSAHGRLSLGRFQISSHRPFDKCGLARRELHVSLAMGVHVPLRCCQHSTRSGHDGPLCALLSRRKSATLGLLCMHHVGTRSIVRIRILLSRDAVRPLRLDSPRELGESALSVILGREAGLDSILVVSMQQAAEFSMHEWVWLPNVERLWLYKRLDSFRYFECFRFDF